MMILTTRPQATRDRVLFECSQYVSETERALQRLHKRLGGGFLKCLARVIRSCLHPARNNATTRLFCSPGADRKHIDFLHRSGAVGVHRGLGPAGATRDPTAPRGRDATGTNHRHLCGVSRDRNAEFSQARGAFAEQQRRAVTAHRQEEAREGARAAWEVRHSTTPLNPIPHHTHNTTPHRPCGSTGAHTAGCPESTRAPSGSYRSMSPKPRGGSGGGSRS